MAYERHRELEPLVLQDTLWRYLDLAKFMAMLMNERLYLTRMDRFDDKFEGFFPSPPKKGFAGLFADQENRRYRSEKAKNKKRFYYANCWHISDIESYAMWKVYVRHNQGLAIRTTFRRLRDSLGNATERLWVAKIRYLHPYVWKKGCPIDPTLHACLTKRKAFQHESEVRVIWLDGDAERSGVPGQDVKAVPCDLATLIEKVYVAPGNPEWFTSIVESVLRTYGVEADVVQSDLDSDPL